MLSVSRRGRLVQQTVHALGFRKACDGKLAQIGPAARGSRMKSRDRGIDGLVPELLQPRVSQFVRARI